MSIKDMVNDIASGNLANAGKAFQDEMMEKIQDAINVERVRVSANLLQPADEVVEESVEIDEETLNEEEMTDKHAKQAAKKIAASHKNFKVTSFEGEHYVHHKDDEDGHEHIKVHAKDGHIHVNHSYGFIGDDKSKHSSVDSAAKTGIKAALGSDAPE
jgi:hypothetical protein